VQIPTTALIETLVQIVLSVLPFAVAIEEAKPDDAHSLSINVDAIFFFHVHYKQKYVSANEFFSRH